MDSKHEWMKIYKKTDPHKYVSKSTNVDFNCEFAIKWEINQMQFFFVANSSKILHPKLHDINQKF